MAALTSEEWTTEQESMVMASMIVTIAGREERNFFTIMVVNLVLTIVALWGC